MLIILHVLLLCCVSEIYTEVCETKEIQTYADTVFLSSAVNHSIIGSSEQSSSALRCMLRCSQPNKYRSFYFLVATQECHCNTRLDDRAVTVTVEPTPNTGLIYGVTNERSKYLPLDRLHILQKERDCLALYLEGFSRNGVYKIYPDGQLPLEAWCDMTGGGWTVIQRRQDGSEDFYRGWDDYVNGFGNRTGEYWLGLETMRILTTEASTLRIELTNFGDVLPISAVATYSNFAIGSPASNYQLTVNGFRGNCGDALTYHSGRAFTTSDRDFDDYGNNCASAYGGAWWYASCHFSNLNGMYLGRVTNANAQGIIWCGCWGYDYPAKTCVMKIRRNC